MRSRKKLSFGLWSVSYDNNYIVIQGRLCLVVLLHFGVACSLVVVVAKGAKLQFGSRVFCSAVVVWGDLCGNEG